MALEIHLVCLLQLLVALPLANAKVFDLSHVHDESSFMAPGNPPYQRNVTYSGEFVPGVFVEHGTLFSGEHGGTHMDAPYHFDKHGKHLHEIPIDYTILDGVMIDCSGDVNGNQSYVMPLRALLDWEKEHGRIPQGAAIIVNFGWSSRFGDPLQYVNTLDITDISKCLHPSVSKEAAEWMVKERDARLLGVDSMGADLFKDVFPIHTIFLGNDRLLLENLKDTGRLPHRGFRLHATPVKYKGATGAQVRVYAISSDSTSNKGQRLVSCIFGASSLVGVIFSIHLFFLKF